MKSLKKLTKLLHSLESIRSSYDKLNRDELVEISFTVSADPQVENECWDCDYFNISVGDMTLLHYLQEEEQTILQELSNLGVDIEKLYESEEEG